MQRRNEKTRKASRVSVIWFKGRRTESAAGKRGRDKKAGKRKERTRKRKVVWDIKKRT